LVYRDGNFIELDENNIPQGVWRYDDVAGMWIFDITIPYGFTSPISATQQIGTMPQTGDATFASTLWLLLRAIGVATIITGTVAIITKKRRKSFD